MEIDRSSSTVMTMEELKHCLLCTTLELENTKIAMEEELKKRDNQLLHLKGLLDMTIAERDEAQERCQSLLLQNLLLHQQQQLMTGASSAQEEDELRRRARKEDQIINGCCFNFSSSGDCEVESSASSKTLDSMVPHDKPLPEKGKLLQAVMRAAPLLQTLLLAGPLPQWRRPPPSISSSEIPPVKIPSPPLPTVFLQDSLINCSRACGKRGVPNDFFESPTTESKCQRPLLL